MTPSPIIIISGQDDMATAVDLLKEGARDYIVKNDNTKDLLCRAIINLRENRSLKQEVETLRCNLKRSSVLKVLLENVT